MNVNPNYSARTQMKILGRALRGESIYMFGVSLPVEEEDYLERKVGTVTALSPAEALTQIITEHPEGFDISLSVVDTMVCVQRFIAHPCRAARWVLFYRQMIRREREAIVAMLGEQAIKRAGKEIKSGTASGIGAVTPDAQTTLPIPDDEAAATIASRNAVIREDHAGEKPESSEIHNSKTCSACGEPTKWGYYRIDGMRFCDECKEARADGIHHDRYLQMNLPAMADNKLRDLLRNNEAYSEVRTQTAIQNEALARLSERFESLAKPPKSFLKFLFLKIGVETKEFAFGNLTEDEKELVAEAMFDGRHWALGVLDELDRMSDPISDKIRDQITCRLGGNSNMEGQPA